MFTRILSILVGLLGAHLTALPAQAPEAVATRIAGTVFDSRGEPIAGVTVIGYCQDTEEGWHEVTTVTDEKGAFVIEGVPEGTEASIQLQAEGYLDGGAHAGVIAGRADVKLMLVEVARIRGVIRDAGGAARAGVVVRAESTEEDVFAPRGAFGISDRSGAFDVAPLEAGSYRLSVRSSRHGTAEGGLIRVAAGEIGEGGELVLDEGLALKGTVLDDEHAPIEGASVQAIPLGLDPKDLFEHVFDRHRSGYDYDVPDEGALTDGEGRFRVLGLKAGRQYLLFAGHANYRPRTVSMSSTWLADEPRYEPGAPGVVLALDRLAAVRVRVVDEADEPLSEATVMVRQGGGSSWRPVDEHGVHETGGLSATEVTVRATAPGYAPGERSGLELAPGSTLEVCLRLAKGATLAGIVVDTEAKPLAGVSLYLMEAREGGWWISRDPPLRSDEDGRFRHDSLDPDRRYQFWLVGRGYLAFEGTETEDGGPVVYAPSREDLRFVMRAGAAISGTLRGPAGKIVSDGSLSIEGEHEFDDRWYFHDWFQQREDLFGLPVPEESPSGKGAFRFGGLVPGSYRVHYTDDNEQVYSTASLRLKAWEQLEHNLVLGTDLRPTSAQVTVQTTEGVPLSGAKVKVSRANGWSATETGSEGTATFHDLRGSRLSVELEGYGPAADQELPCPIQPGDHVIVRLVPR